MMWGGNFAPQGWAFCNGQLLAVSQNDALFSILGTTYGGDGRTTFGLPDFRGRVPMSSGQGPGLTNRPLGQKGGSVYVQLTTNQIPEHNHTTDNAPIDFLFQLKANSGAGSTNDPAGNFLSQSTDNLYTTDSSAATKLMGRSNLDLEIDETILATGGNQQHYNLQPYLPISFIIATAGVYPTRT